MHAIYTSIRVVCLHVVKYYIFTRVVIVRSCGRPASNSLSAIQASGDHCSKALFNEPLSSRIEERIE